MGKKPCNVFMNVLFQSVSKAGEIKKGTHRHACFTAYFYPLISLMKKDLSCNVIAQVVNNVMFVIVM